MRKRDVLALHCTGLDKATRLFTAGGVYPVVQDGPGRLVTVRDDLGHLRSVEPTETAPRFLLGWADDGAGDGRPLFAHFEPLSTVEGRAP